MYIHLGNEITISEKGIIGIFDIENTSLGNDTRQYLKKASDDGNVVNVSMEIPKTFIVCADADKKESVYISQISAATLRKRSEMSI